MDTCVVDENCGMAAVDECELCGNLFCKKHGDKEEHICFLCKQKEEDEGEDVSLF